jgi:glycosyltransferase involved in cell wall biosynthesis
MKILITTDNIGGVWTFSLNLARGLKRSGIDVVIAIIGNPLSVIQRKELGSLTWYFFGSKQEWMPDPWHDIERSGRWLLKLKNLESPDIVHLNTYTYGSLPWNVPVVITAHSCVLSWWDAVKAEQPPSWLSDYRKHVTEGIQSADVVVAPGKEMMKAVQKFYSPLNKSKVIYNGGDFSGFCTDIKEEYIFCMGRLWDEAKNIKLVLEAAPEINYPVYIAGDLEKPYTSTIPKNVFFIGQVPRDQIRCWLAKAAIYLLPVIYEPFGYTFLEAAFSGCAIVTGRIPSMKEIWGDDVIFADTRDSIGLAKTINSLMSDAPKRNMLAMNAGRRAMLKYKSERMTSEYILLYREILEQNIRKNLKLQEQ